MIKVLNLGAGVQSSCILLMSCRGLLPKLDCAIFADTGWEPEAVYAHLKWLTDEAERHGIHMVTVTAGNLKEAALISQVRGRKVDGVRWASLPLRVLNPDGTTGMVRRQCTSEYKIQPIEKYIRRELLGVKPNKWAPREPVVEQWFGISQDEAGRSKRSDKKWVRFQYPLMNWPEKMLTKTWRRQDCVRWLQENYPNQVVPRSACIGCPYHTREEWNLMKRKSPDEFKDAVNFDHAIRKAEGMRGDLYIHQSCKPLDTIDFRNDIQKGQGHLWEDECDGVCGV